jgi:hypothetical protein
VIRHLGSHERAVCEQADEEAFFLGIRIYFNEVFTQEGLPTRNQKPQATRLRDLVKDTEYLFSFQLLIYGILIIGGQVTIAMGAAEVATKGKFNGPIDWNPLF